MPTRAPSVAVATTCTVEIRTPARITGDRHRKLDGAEDLPAR